MSFWRNTFTGSVAICDSAFRVVTEKTLRRLLTREGYAFAFTGPQGFDAHCPLCESPGLTLRCDYPLDSFTRPASVRCRGPGCEANAESVASHLRISSVVARANSPRKSRPRSSHRRFARRQPGLRPMPPRTVPRDVTPMEAAQRLGCSPQFLAQLRSLGKGPTYTYAAGLLSYNSGALAAWAAKRPLTSTDAGAAP